MIKKVLKYGGIAILLGIAIYISNELFIREWRIKHAEERVQKRIKENFQTNKLKFKKLKHYLEHLNINPVAEIEFLRENKIWAHLRSHTLEDSIYNNSQPHYFSSGEDEYEMDVEFTLLQTAGQELNIPSRFMKAQTGIGISGAITNTKTSRKLLNTLEFQNQILIHSENN